MLKKVPTVRTRFSQIEFVKAAIQAWRNLYNVEPKKENVGIIFAQWSLETGQGGDCWNFNIGNVKAVDNPNETVEYCVLKGVWEIINGKKVFLDENDPGSWFRSFNSLDEGMIFHFKFLRNKRYKKAWEAVEQGLPVEFCRLLKIAGYYTADEEHYRNAVLYYFNKYKKDRLFEKAMVELNLLKNEEVNNENAPLNINIIRPNYYLDPNEREIDFNLQDDTLELNFFQKLVNKLMKLIKMS